MEENKIQIPIGWGEDSLTAYFQLANDNCYASFVNLKDDYLILLRINSLFESLRKNPVNEEDKLIINHFLYRSHSAFLAGVRLAMSCELVEANMVLRGVLENSLYGFYLHNNPELAVTWLNRQQNDESKEKAKETFKPFKMIDLLKQKNEYLYTIASKLYDMTIDLGAHPNFLALALNMDIFETENTKHYNYNILNTDSQSIEISFKIAGRVGLCSLCVFQMVFQKHFDNLGVSAGIELLKEKL